MAAAATLFPAMPGSINFSRPKLNQQLPFDADLLARKLEAHQLQQDAERRRSEHCNNKNNNNIDSNDHGVSSQRRASYVPRMAAEQFAATTTPMRHNIAQEYHRSKSLSLQAMPDMSADGMSAINPKQLLAALNLGMSENEVLTTMVTEAPSRWSSFAQQQTRKDSMASDLPSPSSESTETQHGTVTRGYKPGDAAKRNALRRQSRQVSLPPQCKRGSQGREYYLEFRDQIKDLPGHDSGMCSDSEESTGQPQRQSIGTLRPKIVPTDRPDWSQQSECGDDEVRHTVSIPLRRKDKTSSDRDEARKAQQSSNAVQRPLQERIRQKSAPGHLVSDAVQLIKKEEKAARRQSIVDFFKRR